LIILGLYNDSRGKDSCGYYFNGNIDKGIQNESEFSKYLVNNRFEPGDLKTKLFMGHTRKATIGSHSYENAHPHVVNDNYVQTHNGYLKNIWAMGTKYNVDHSKIWVDSMVLAQLIAKEGPKKILDEYTGYAAMAFTYMLEPEVLYLYHGASREKKDDEHPIMERPLYVLYQSEGVYYSSMKEPLDIINSESETAQPFVLKSNVVWQIVNGEFTGETIEIDRENNNISIPQHNSNFSSKNNYAGYLPPAKKQVQTKLFLSDYNPQDIDKIMEEEEPQGGLINDVIYWKGRYHKIGVINGNRALILLDGKVVINYEQGKGVIQYQIASTIVPQSGEIYYFINGVMITNGKDYEKLRQDKIDGLDEESFRILSTKSRYPIIQIRNTEGVGQTKWFYKGYIVKRKTINPRFSNKHYKIRHGKTKQITGRIIQPTNWQHNHHSQQQIVH
jgi:hypothetical protein